MIRYGRYSLLVALFILCMVGARASEPKVCVQSSLVFSYLESNPGWSTVALSDLSLDDQQLWVRRHPNLCPGMAAGKLDSSARTWYALALLKNDHGKIYERVVLLVKNKHELTSQMLSVSQEVSSPFVVWRARPGIFLDYRTGKKVIIKYDSFVYEKIESAAVQYYLRDGRIRKLIATY